MPETPVVYDLTVLRHSRLFSAFMGFAICVLIITPIAIASQIPRNIERFIPFPTMVVAFVIGERYATWRTRRRLNNILKSTANADPETILGRVARCLEPYGGAIAEILGRHFRTRNVLGDTARLLSRSGFNGSALRISHVHAPLPPFADPFDTPFQPIPLRGTNSAFPTSAGGPLDLDQPAAHDRLRHDTAPFVPAAPWGRRIMVALGWLVLGLMAAYVVRELARARMVNVLGIVGPGCVIAVILLLVGMWRPQEWFALPGAIVVRTSSWRSERWRLHVIRRADGVLAYWNTMQTLSVAASDGTVFSRRATLDEAELAFRAWLSPLEPPPREQLSNLE